jgi:enoyl-CoA hydratase/carnithine racemase
MSKALVLLREQGRVAEVVLDRPEALNALSTEMLRQLTAVFDQLATSKAIAAAVVSSATERAFSAGADLKERASFSGAEMAAQRPVVRAAFDALRAVEVPVVAAVAGYALGGGFELALSCDLIVADGSAVVGLPEVSVGLVPGGGGTYLLARRAGPGAAADLIFTGRRVPAPEAFRLGLVDRLVEQGGARSTALELAGAMAANSPVALRAAKRALRVGAGADLVTGLEVEDAAWRAAASSDDRAEGIRAFVEKRTPAWPTRP